MSAGKITLTGVLVKKSNVLARAIWAPESVIETRLIALVTARIRVDDQDFQDYDIPVTELIQQHGGRDYQELMIGVDKLMSRIITIKEAGGWVKYNIFSRCRYLLGLGVLQVSFNPDLRPHFLNLKERFVQYNLIEYMQLPSVYSQRIYEFLMSWKAAGQVEIPIDELHEMLCTAEVYRRDFFAFKSRILAKAHGDINKKTMFKYHWETVKKGRKVVAVRFIFDQRLIAEQKRDGQVQGKQAEIDVRNKQALAAFACHQARGGVCDMPKGGAVCTVCEVMGFFV